MGLAAGESVVGEAREMGTGLSGYDSSPRYVARGLGGVAELWSTR